MKTKNLINYSTAATIIFFLFLATDEIVPRQKNRLCALHELMQNEVIQWKSIL